MRGWRPASRKRWADQPSRCLGDISPGPWTRRVRLRHDPEMNRDRVLALLAEHKPALADRFGVTSLKLFGSFARDTARPDSDVDVLVAFDGPATSKRYFGVQFYLEDLIGRDIDLVTEDALRPRLRPYVERDALAI